MRQLRRWLAAALIVTLTCSGTLTGYAAAAPPDCDETLYITLDGHGAIEDSSIVKRYAVLEDGEITDYGRYEVLKNLSTKAEPVVGEDGSYTFPVKAEDGAFYIEGKTAVAESDLPWKIEVSYLLNGVKTEPEKLAGASGLVEITVDLLPNKNVSDYYRNNMALTMTTMVDMDEVLSLRAEGAQVQTVGNMSAVAFFALPGEECHYTIAIGSEDFSFTGLIFLMVPLTMEQLNDVGDLREAKEKVEDSGEALSDSLDVILDTMEQMRGGLADTADGLRSLDDARGIIHSSKDSIYAQADEALDSLGGLASSLEPFEEHMNQAQDALNSIRLDLDDMIYDIDELGPQLGDLKNTVRYLRDDMKEIWDAMNSPQFQMASSQFTALMGKTHADLQGMREAQGRLGDSLEDLEMLLARMQSVGAALEASDILDEDIPDEDIEDEEGRARTASGSNWNNPYVMATVGEVIDSTVGLVGSTGVTDDAAGMILLTEQVLTALAQKQATGAAAVHEMGDLLTIIGRIGDVGEDLTEDIDGLNLTLEKYHPEALSALADVGRMTENASASLSSMEVFLRTVRRETEKAADPLNEGARESLNGLADVLDRAGEGLAETGVLRSAKDTVKSTIEDEWDRFSGEHTTILDIDLDAAPMSFTSDKNPSPHSMQIILRTKEILEDADDTKAEVDESFRPDGNILHRIGNIFKRIWEAICSLFS